MFMLDKPIRILSWIWYYCTVKVVGFGYILLAIVTSQLCFNEPDIIGCKTRRLQNCGLVSERCATSFGAWKLVSVLIFLYFLCILFYEVVRWNIWIYKKLFYACSVSVLYGWIKCKECLKCKCCLSRCWNEREVNIR